MARPGRVSILAHRFAYLASSAGSPLSWCCLHCCRAGLRQRFPWSGLGCCCPPTACQSAALPDYSKNTAATVGMMLGTLIFGPGRLLKFCPRWFDLPMLLWCLCGIVTSLQNGLGIYDGLSDALTVTITWGMPYLFGRLYFGDPEGLRTFITSMFIGGLCYVPSVPLREAD